VIELLERALLDARAGKLSGVMLVEFGERVAAQLAGSVSLGDLALGGNFAARIVSEQIDKADSTHAEV
jgi:hypothetical protein